MYRTITLHFGLYGCKTRFLILREEHRFRVFKSRAVGKIFGPKREEVTGNCRKLHNEELHELHFLPDIWIINQGE
jgi:hypothetical protein